MSWGLDVEPTVAFREGQHKKEELKTMKKQLSLVGLAAFALLAFSPSPVRANLVWDFSYFDTATGGSIIQASGTLTTTALRTPLTGYGISGLSGYDITAISGERNGVLISGIQSNPAFPGSSTSPGNYYDNALVGSPFGLDVDGLNFYAGETLYNLSVINPFTGGTGYYDTANANLGNGATLTAVTLSLTPVPEPTTMIAGALLLLPFGASTLRMLRKRTA
jgi:hypothetical protein